MPDDGAPREGAALVDEARVAMLQRDPAEWSEIVAMYREYTAELLEAAARDVERREWPLVVRHMHQLKGCSANLGLLAVTALCGELEVQVRAGQPLEPTKDVERLRALIARSVTALG